MRIFKENLKDISYYLSGSRLYHSLSVSELMEKWIGYLYEVYRYYLVQVAAYHDIGYSKRIPQDTGHHSTDGYFYIRGKVHPLTAYLILRHSGAKNYFEDTLFRGFYNEIEKLAFKEVAESGNIDIDKLEGMVDLLTICDILVNYEGKSVSSMERLQSKVWYR